MGKTKRCRRIGRCITNSRMGQTMSRGRRNCFDDIVVSESNIRQVFQRLLGLLLPPSERFIQRIWVTDELIHRHSTHAIVEINDDVFAVLFFGLITVTRWLWFDVRRWPVHPLFFSLQFDNAFLQMFGQRMSFGTYDYLMDFQKRLMFRPSLQTCHLNRGIFPVEFGLHLSYSAWVSGTADMVPRPVDP